MRTPQHGASSCVASVAMICPQYWPMIGGYERAAERLSTAIASSGTRVVVVTERRSSTWPKAEARGGVSIRRLSCVPRPKLHVVSSLASFTVYLLRNGRTFKVWHVHQYGPHAALAVVLGRLMGRPTVLKLTSTGPMGISTSLAGGSLYRRCIRALLRRVDGCVAVSREALSEGIRFGIPQDRMHLIANGVDGVAFSPTDQSERTRAREKLGLPSKRVLLAVGRLSAEKNLSGLLRAWASLSAPGWVLAVVGDGPEKAALDSMLLELALSERVVMAGHMDSVLDWYRAADMFVLSSHTEGLSNAMVEALASGLPVVTTRVSGTGECIEEPGAGLVVEVGDESGLAQAISRLIADDSERSQMARRAREVFERQLDIRAVADRTLELYRSLCPDGR